MKRIILLLIFYTLTTSQELKNINSTQLKTLIESHKDKKVILVNFWATWCKPCLKEIPTILKIQKKYENFVEVILISMDSPKKKSRVLKFLNSQNISFKSYLKTESDEFFMNSMPDEWSGDLPYTMIYSKNGSAIALLEDEQTFESLNDVILKMMK